MAENDQERTEQPTGKRIEEARQEGRVPRSAEANAAAVLLVAAGSLHFLGGSLGGNCSISSVRPQRAHRRGGRPGAGARHSRYELARALMACAPIFGLTLLAALLAPFAVGGWNLSFEALVPDFTRLDPIQGFGRFFSARGAVELGKAFAKFLVVAAVAVACTAQTIRAASRTRGRAAA